MLTSAQVQSARQSLGINPTPTPTQDRAAALTQSWGTQSTTPSITPTKDPFNPFPVGNTEPTKQSHLSDIPAQAKAGASRFSEGLKEANPSAPSTGVLDSAGHLVEGVGKMLGGAASVVTSPAAPIFKPLSVIMGDIGNKVGDNKQVQQFAESPQGQATAKVAATVGDYANAAGTVAGAEGASESLPGAVDKIKTSASDAMDSFNNPEVTPKSEGVTATPKVDTSGIVDNYTQAIKPTIAGKKTPAALDAYNNNVVSAIKSIVDNKDNLSFTNADGESVTGNTPKTVGELTQAIDQTKAGIFQKYDALAKQTGNAGIKISADPVVSELDRVISNEALQVSHPEAIAEAKAIRARIVDSSADGSIGAPKAFDPEVVQEIIKGYNSSLEAFYKNPSYDSASRAAVAAGTVRAFRQALGDAIQNATGENYSGLKQQYGALSSIEGDVAKRALVIARQSSATGGSGISDYAQVFAGGDMVHGLLSLNPALFAKGAAQSTLTKVFTYLKSPDRAIGKMFEAAQ